jgi:hypothetical protein
MARRANEKTQIAVVSKRDQARIKRARRVALSRAKEIDVKYSRKNYRLGGIMLRLACWERFEQAGLRLVKRVDVEHIDPHDKKMAKQMIHLLEDIFDIGS